MSKKPKSEAVYPFVKGASYKVAEGAAFYGAPFVEGEILKVLRVSAESPAFADASGYEVTFQRANGEVFDFAAVMGPSLAKIHFIRL